MFTRLKALKVEIEHLQLLMDKAKVKLQKEFEAWWAEEATSLQVRAAMPLTAPEPPCSCGLGNIRVAGEGPDMQPPWHVGRGGGGCVEADKWGLRPSGTRALSPCLLKQGPLVVTRNVSGQGSLFPC